MHGDDDFVLRLYPFKNIQVFFCVWNFQDGRYKPITRFNINTDKIGFNFKSNLFIWNIKANPLLVRINFIHNKSNTSTNNYVKVIPMNLIALENIEISSNMISLLLYLTINSYEVKFVNIDSEK